MNQGRERVEKDPVNPATIMRHVYGAYPSFAMLAAMKLDVFTPLQDGSREAGDLAKSLGVGEEKLIPLLHALVAADLLQIENNRFANTGEAGKYLVRGRPDYIGGLSGFYGNLWQAALKTAESIKTGKPQAKLDWHTLPEGELRRYFRSQLDNSLRAGQELMEKLDFSGFEHLLDAGGGSGGVAMSICNRFPSVKATVADLPAVVRLTERFIAEAGCAAQISVSATDLCSGSPEGLYDVAVLRAFLQTLGKEQARAVLRNVGRCMAAGGKLFVIGSILDNSCLSPAASLAWGLVFLNVYDHGRSYSEKEYAEMLENTGFADITIEHNAFVDGYGLITAEKQRTTSS